MLALPIVHDMFDFLKNNPDISDKLNFPKLQRFFRLCRRHLFREADPESPEDPTVLPAELDLPLRTFLSSALGLEENLVQRCWSGMRTTIAESCYWDVTDDDDLFRMYGDGAQIGAMDLIADLKTCLGPDCNRRNLRKEAGVSCRIFTLRRGVLPAYYYTLYCSVCSTRYYPNYYVQRPGDINCQRVYYGGIPSVLHVFQKAFVEVDLIEHFEWQMMFQHSSAQSIARVYNRTLGRTNQNLPWNGALSAALDADLVYESFFLHALLRDHQKQNSILSVPHGSNQRRWLDQALQERNLRIAGNGQPLWAHACKKCMKIQVKDDGTKVCREPLASARDRFCPLHQSQALVCAIDGCKNPAELSHLTCTAVEHRQAEDDFQVRRTTAMSQLKARFQRAGVPLLNDVDPVVENDGSITEAIPSSTARLTGQMSRRWTHNEQLVVYPCGIIASRCTFYNSEAVSGVKDSHEYCNQNCNPAGYPELQQGEKWTFNSSAAEQTNTWFGAFHPIVKEMLQWRYNFFCDEMIMLRNEWTEEELFKEGSCPIIRSESFLRGGDW
ncbi:hypothetical protein VNI00_010291 [Paramarasmius palmivorus]|uniref:CxC5 like cysteine cluster associated with KDZ domain-containing protein n=1 Tax=Paramarasmius palmivorus TaxID=297713 RepID=A0AAW0CIW0_9AGAR